MYLKNVLFVNFIVVTFTPSQLLYIVLCRYLVEVFFGQS